MGAALGVLLTLWGAGVSSLNSQLVCALAQNVAAVLLIFFFSRTFCVLRVPVLTLAQLYV